MERKKQNNFYDLFCLVEKSKKDEFIIGIKKVLGDGIIKITEESKLMPAYKVKQIEEGCYITVLFHNTSSEKIQQLRRDFLNANKIRNILLNENNKKDETKFKAIIN